MWCNVLLSADKYKGISNLFFFLYLFNWIPTLGIPGVHNKNVLHIYVLTRGPVGRRGKGLAETKTKIT